jgi:hypothetical protein
MELGEACFITTVDVSVSAARGEESGVQRLATGYLGSSFRPLFILHRSTAYPTLPCKAGSSSSSVFLDLLALRASRLLAHFASRTEPAFGSLCVEILADLLSSSLRLVSFPYCQHTANNCNQVQIRRCRRQTSIRNGRAGKRIATRNHRHNNQINAIGSHIRKLLQMDLRKDTHIMDSMRQLQVRMCVHITERLRYLS